MISRHEAITRNLLISVSIKEAYNYFAARLICVINSTEIDVFLQIDMLYFGEKTYIVSSPNLTGCCYFTDKVQTAGMP